MLTAFGDPCDVVLWRLGAGDALVRLWLRRIDRACWRRGFLLPSAVVEGLARRVAAAVAVWRDVLAVRLPWGARRARCGSARVALRSLSQAVRGVSC